MQSKIEPRWMTDDGELIVRSPRQSTLSETTAAKTAQNMYRLFRSEGNLAKAQEYMRNINHAMQIAYEQDGSGKCRTPSDPQGPRLI
ncbi:hypothetical protein [Legionella bononiensis]|uniref:Uncharacterized protein n=1 Tax=Legionella bononiensis TaxID=2793102 RepID=A0ABS1WG33_9GAMM|nr:hypothetical protein [Legionella bononiensis]MBL7481692.1 hypothetical protein [Legionella bononiensis]MBL7528240.1 hypothetical protein [Legionella bononiensis]MBL7562715.1 hypothetical protein [Legionella bononiensis]